MDLCHFSLHDPIVPFLTIGLWLRLLKVSKAVRANFLASAQNVSCRLNLHWAFPPIRNDGEPHMPLCGFHSWVVADHLAQTLESKNDPNYAFYAQMIHIFSINGGNILEATDESLSSIGVAQEEIRKYMLSYIASKKRRCHECFGNDPQYDVKFLVADPNTPPSTLVPEPTKTILPCHLRHLCGDCTKNKGGFRCLYRPQSFYNRRHPGLSLLVVPSIASSVKLIYNHHGEKNLFRNKYHMKWSNYGVLRGRKDEPGEKEGGH